MCSKVSLEQMFVTISPFATFMRADEVSPVEMGDIRMYGQSIFL